MAFSEFEKAALLEVKGVGPMAVKRFEEIGIDSFSKLSARNAEDIAENGGFDAKNHLLENSPQALSAVEAAISRARKGL